MRTLVLVLATRQRPFPDLIRAQKRTWAARDVEDVEVLFYYGGSKLALHGRDLFVETPDEYWSVGHKTLACFDYVLAQRDFDLIFRTNCSSYVDLPNLREWVGLHARRTDYYAGAVDAGTLEQMLRVQRQASSQPGTPGARDLTGTPGPPTGWSFASGAGYFLSRDLAEWVVGQRSLWDHSFVDDMALGKLLSERGVVPEPAPRVVLGNAWQPRTIDTSAFLFRCKTDSSWRRGDIDLMLKVDDAFAKARGEVPTRWYTPVRGLKLAARAIEAKARR
jgi:hypothetical protein